MSLLQLPEIRADHRLASAQFDLRPDALDRWCPGVRSAASDGDASISIYEQIGEGWDGVGVSAKRIGAALRNIGPRDITVNINSPGGDFFEGVAIYNLLREHQGKVTVRVVGIAASAASVIAMAGDEIVMSPVAMMMIHNPATISIGDEREMQKAIDMLSEVKESIINAYEIKTGMGRGKISNLMDAESWMNAKKAVELGFADSILFDEHAAGEQADELEAMMFSRAAVTNSLLSKFKKPKSDNRVDAGLLKKRLFLITH